MASMLAALVSLVMGFRAARGVERQQLRWVAAGATAAVAGLLVGMAGVVVTCFAVLCVPVGVAVAVLRYRLWDLDRLVSRTVTYALVTTLPILPYLLILPAVTRLFEGSGSLAVAAVTLAAAALFQPLRRRIQDLVDPTRPRCGSGPGLPRLAAGNSLIAAQRLTLYSASGACGAAVFTFSCWRDR